MNYYWFTRQEILQKVKENYSKEKAAEYYKEEKDKIKEYQRKKYQELAQYKKEALKK